MNEEAMTELAPEHKEKGDLAWVQRVKGVGRENLPKVVGLIEESKEGECQSS